MKIILVPLFVFLFPLFSWSENVGTSEFGSQGQERVESAEPTENKNATSTLEKVGQTAKEAVSKVNNVLNETRVRRESEDYFALLSYSPVDLLIPGKYGLTVGFMSDVDKTWEFEYLQGSLSVPAGIEDIGSMKDERMSLIARNYFGTNSFNMSYGLSYFDFSIHLGGRIMSQVNPSFPSSDLVRVAGIGPHIGVGNRWTFKHNITLSVDWVSWAQPLMITKKEANYLDHSNNQKDKDDVESAMNIVSYFPRFAFFKIQFGMLF